MANASGNGPTPGGAFVAYGLSSSTVLKTARGVLFRISVITSGTTVGAAYDFDSITSPTNEIASIPNVVGVYELIWPCQTGITIVPGTGQVLSVSYE